MKIVIDIPDEYYHDNIINEMDCLLSDYFNGTVCEITPLPKGHGRLIDADEITAFRELECNGHNVESLNEFTVIIEADKESEE